MRILTAGVAAILFFAPGTAADVIVTHRISSEQPIGGVKRLLIDFPQADIQVVPGSAAVLRIDGQVTRSAGSAEDSAHAQRIVDAIGAGVQVTSTRATILPSYSPTVSGSRLTSSANRISLKISVPRGTHIEIRQHAGSARVAGEGFGDIDIRMRRGRAEVTVPKSDVRELDASSRLGEVAAHLPDRVITKEGLLAGHIHVFFDGGASKVLVKLQAGDAEIHLTP